MFYTGPVNRPFWQAPIRVSQTRTKPRMTAIFVCICQDLGGRQPFCSHVYHYTVMFWYIFLHINDALYIVGGIDGKTSQF